MASIPTELEIPIDGQFERRESSAAYRISPPNSDFRILISRTDASTKASQAMPVAHVNDVDEGNKSNAITIATPDALLFAVFIDGRSVRETDTTNDRNNFLETVYSVDQKISTRHAASVIIDRVDDLLSAGDTPECDEILKEAKVERLSNTALVTLLGITVAAKNKLKYRDDFYRRAMHAVAIRRGDDGAAQLLGKYR